jgi:hypothetical protein
MYLQRNLHPALRITTSSLQGVRLSSQRFTLPQFLDREFTLRHDLAYTSVYKHEKIACVDAVGHSQLSGPVGILEAFISIYTSPESFWESGHIPKCG